jgi:hypothetical protein
MEDREGGTPVSVILLERPDSASCARFRAEYQPALEKRFGSQIRIIYRDADALGLEKTPMLVFSAKDTTPIVVSGLSHYYWVEGLVEETLRRHQKGLRRLALR